MKKILLFGIIFLTFNVFLTQVHIWVFQSRLPFSVFLSVLIHIVGLIYFPYSKFFNSKTLNSKNK